MRKNVEETARSITDSDRANHICENSHDVAEIFDTCMMIATLADLAELWDGKNHDVSRCLQGVAIAIKNKKISDLAFFIDVFVSDNNKRS